MQVAAERADLVDPDLVAERLDDRFRLLIGSSRTAVPRHQTLQAAIDWSYALLSESEQAVLRRLSVFAGGWTLDAAEAVSAGGEVAKDDILDRLSQLVDKSLVIMREQAGKARYNMLETIRQYAWERLVDSGEGAAIRRQHAEYFLALAQESGGKLWGAEQIASAERLEAEHDNLRAALAWSPDVAEMSRKHNDANILVLPARYMAESAAVESLRRWLETAFEGGRHARRVQKIEGTARD